MSNLEFLESAKVPYKRLLGYVKPYKSRFAMGVVFGIIAGFFNMIILFGLKFVFAVILDPDPTAGAEAVATSMIEEAAQLSALAEQLGEDNWAEQARLLSESSVEVADATEKTLTLTASTQRLEFLAKKLEASALDAGNVEMQEEAKLAIARAKRLTDSSVKALPVPEGEGFQPFKKVPGMEHVVVKPPELPPGYEWIWIAGVCAIVPFLILLRGLWTYLHQYCMIWVGNKVLYQLRDEVFSNLLSQSLSFYGKAKTGELMQTCFNQTRMAQTAGTQLASDLIKHPISILSIMIFLLLINPIYTLASMVVFPLCIFPVMAVSKRVRKAGGREEEEAGMLMVTMQETFSGIRVVKSSAREEYEREKFNAADRRMLALIMRWRKAMEIVGPLVETVASVGIAAGLVYAKITGMTAGEFLLLNMALMSMYPHAKALSRVQVNLQKCLIATTKVFSLIDLESDIRDKPDAVELKDAKGKIQFFDVKFRYKGADELAVKQISTKLRAGHNYALVGRSGSGKSTLLSLIMRFYDPIDGHIKLDNIDLRDIKQQSLRDNIGIVNQELFLFHDTILNNIRYGDPKATDEQVYKAAERAFAHEFIMEKEGGYNAIVGDKGCTLSGGQQQRISIARAILRDAPILLLDEAYSALDSESEKKIHAAMEELARGKTVIAIAHRLSTILNADEILVMEQGRIIDKGTHSELLEKSEAYQKLYNLQFHGHLIGPEATV